jgi:microcin C transport system substrate-binding protein
MEVPEDRSWVIFNLRPQAKFHDGSPITADDVVFSLSTLREKGQPFFRFYYGGVDKVEKLGERRVRFTFKAGDNRELPLIVGQMPILSQKYWSSRDFSQSTLEAPLGSGPYRVESFEPGRFIRYERVKDFWAKDLPVLKGQYNFDSIRYDFYRDSTVALEAFKAGEYDFRAENAAKDWATGYEFPAVQSGEVIKAEIPHERPTGMQGFIYNIRRDIFSDPRVRRALAYAFDFEWANKNLFYGQYTRTKSYFSNSELASTGLPQGHELELLEPHRAKLPAEVFTKTYAPPTTDGSGNIRDNLRTAMQLLREAGWTVKNGKLVDAQGRPFTFEILLNQPNWERISLPFVRNLERLGVTASVRTVDTAQYKNRTDAFDFDMTVEVFPQSNSPGNEQADFWGSHSAKEPGGRNTIGIADPVIDELIDKVIAAPTREALVARTRALDRVLLWHHYVIPNWHLNYDRVAYWNKFGRPETVPEQGYQFMSWWAAEKRGPQPANTGR